MRIHVRAFAFCLLLTSASPGSSGVARENPLFDRYGNITFEAEKFRLNNYAIQLQNSPGSRGVIIAYSGGPWTAREVRARARRAMRYLVKKRGVSARRLQWRYERSCGEGSILLYLFYPNETDPAPDPNCMRA
jgi:hypothetical protein